MMVKDPDPALWSSLRTWRLTALAAIAVGVAAVLWSGYRVVDAGVTYTYQQAELGYREDAQRLLERVVLRVSTSTTQSELVQILRELKVEAFEKEDGIYADGLGFFFSEAGTLVCISADYTRDDSECAPPAWTPK
jgi:predicted Zn-dependent protease